MKHFSTYLTSIVILTLIAGTIVMSCGNTTVTPAEVKDPVQSQQFKDFWYRGKAELNVYELTQWRYGQPRQGHATHIYVTEPFDREKQVKSDNKDDNDVNVLKVNRTRKFNTGIYPYSLMTSSFTVADTEAPTGPLKVTQSSQEWCGHTWVQLNKQNKDYRYQQFSYFETEGDIDETFATDLSEDGIWAQIRLNPEALPQGDFKIFPAIHYLRFTHNKPMTYLAKGSLKQAGDSMIYTLQYINIQRTLKITFDRAFPHAVRGWTESVLRGGEEQVTSGRLKSRDELAYWALNSLQDSIYRAQLKLDD